MEKQRSKKPLIRFPEFKDTWEHKRLNELLSEAKKRNEELKYGKDQVLSVSGELGIINQIEHLGRSYAGVSVHNYHVVEVGAIVYTKSPLKATPFGIIKLNKGKAGIVSTMYAVYKVNQQTAYGLFIDYYFSLNANTNRYLRPLVRKGAKNTLQLTNEEAISAEIFVPTIPEQIKIASFLTVLEKKIEELKQKKTLLEHYKKGVMQKLFSQELRFKDDNEREFPKWAQKKLGSVVKINQGLQIAISERYTEKIEGSYFYITNEFLKDNSEKKYFIKNPPQSVLCTKNDILMTRTGNTGVVIMNAEGAFHNNFFRIKYPPYINKNFLFYFLNLPSTQNQIIKLAGTSTIPDLNHSDFYSIEIPIIDYEEQTKIADFLSAIDEKINYTQTQIEKTELYKKGLLQKMFC